MSYYLPDTSVLEIKGEMKEGFEEILSPEAIEFLIKLHQKFNGKRLELLEKRIQRQKELDKGILPDFLPYTKHIRESEWVISPLPADLQDRRVEITGPVDRKMIINALNSGANVFMADFEDSNSPTWENTIQGQINLKEAVRRTISYINPENGKKYQLNDKTAVLFVRPRGWHLIEKHILIEGEYASGTLVDFGLYFFHNAHELINRGTAPYFYLPKIENHWEAKLWNDVFVFAQKELGIHQNSIKATVLIETILAAFEMDEILYELKHHSAGLNCGRWDYIFSFIKKFHKHPQFILPDRAQVTMNVPFMKAYYELLIKTCHKRNAPAMGGMAAQIPIKNDEEANRIAMEKVMADKEREAKAGHDGTWVAHPALVPIAKAQFDKYMPTPHQRHIKREDVKVTAQDLLNIPSGTITLQGLKHNMDVSIQYIEAWLDGKGCVPIYHLMEDAATAEISRAQVWQWVHHQAVMVDGTTINLALYKTMLPAVMQHIEKTVGKERFEKGKYKEAAKLFDQLVTAEHFEEFLTIPAYQNI
ncbi:MAG: malate synthase A [Flammeovirgaceae bacterium]